jgi:hypothetical protein
MTSRRAAAGPLLIWVLIAGLGAAPAAAGWKWVAYGDTRTNDAAHRQVLHAIQTHTPDAQFLINVGDVVEDGGQAAMWDTWQQACNDELGGTGQGQTPPKYLAAPGNHDAVNAAGLTNWNTYLSGQNARYGNGGKFFTFDHQNARFVVLDSTGSLTSSQLTLLQNAIQTNAQDWLFVIWHYPIFDFGPKVYQGAIHTTWGVPLYQNGCDLIFNGDAHYYVRTLKLDLDGQMNPPLDPVRGTVQIVTGNGGAPLVGVDEVHDGNGYMLAYSYDQAQAAFYGYTELTVDGRTLTLRHLRASDGQVMDTATYTANPKPGWPAPTVTPPSAPQADQVLVFPQPGRGDLRVSYSCTGSARVRLDLYNPAGERVLSATDQVTAVQGGAASRLATAGLSPGVYFLTLTVDDAAGQRRLKERVVLSR